MHTAIRSQYLGHPLFELEGGDDLVILQILELSDGQILPQPGPDSFDWIEISTPRWEPHSCQAMLVVSTVNLQEAFIIKPHPQPFEASTLLRNNGSGKRRVHKSLSKPNTQVQQLRP